MATPQIPTEALRFTEARPQLSELLNRVFRREARIVIQKGSIPVAALVSLVDLERLLQLDAEREADFAALDAVARTFGDQTPEQIALETARAVAETRAERRAEREAVLHR